jgi:hypothetical protein
MPRLLITFPHIVDQSHQLPSPPKESRDPALKYSRARKAAKHAGRKLGRAWRHTSRRKPLANAYMKLMGLCSVILAMLGKSNAIAKTHVPIVPLLRTIVFATDTSGHLVRRSEREHSPTLGLPTDAHIGLAMKRYRL